ncbi:AcaB family transcriptional regulator [Pseudomonas aeruginosa]
MAGHDLPKRPVTVGRNTHLTLHTYHAARIWTGRQKSDAKHSILGGQGASRGCRKIRSALKTAWSCWTSR